MPFSNKLLSAAALIAALWLTGCRDEPTPTHMLKVGVMAGLEEQVAQVAQQVAQTQYGLAVELIPFSDYVTPNQALSDGLLDVNLFQHRPYLEQQMTDRGYRLVAVGAALLYPMAGYSKKIERITDLAPGSLIALPNDPTNLGRALLLLQQMQLITLKSIDNPLLPSPLDIETNPHQLKFIELEAPQLPRALDDVDLALINTTYASQLGLSPTRDGLLVEDHASPYVNVIVARADNHTAEKVQQFVQAFQSEAVYQAAQQLFQQGIVKGWE